MRTPEKGRQTICHSRLGEKRPLHVVLHWHVGPGDLDIPLRPRPPPDSPDRATWVGEGPDVVEIPIKKVLLLTTMEYLDGEVNAGTALTLQFLDTLIVVVLLPYNDMQVT